MKQDLAEEKRKKKNGRDFLYIVWFNLKEENKKTNRNKIPSGCLGGRRDSRYLISNVLTKVLIFTF